MEPWTQTVTWGKWGLQFFECCSGVYCDHLNESLLRSWVNFHWLATPGKVYHCFMFLLFVHNCSHCGSMALWPFPDWGISGTLFLMCSWISLDRSMMLSLSVSVSRWIPTHRFPSHHRPSHQLCFGMRFPICRILSTVSWVTVRLSTAHFTPSPMTLLSLWTEAFFMFWPIVASPYDVFSRAEKDFCSSCVRGQCDEVVIESSPRLWQLWQAGQNMH